MRCSVRAVDCLASITSANYHPFLLYDQLQIGRHNINTNYNSLQLIWDKQAEHRSTHRLHVPKALDMLGASNASTPTTPFDYHNDYGPEVFGGIRMFNASCAYPLGDPAHKRFLGGLINTE